MTPHPVLAAVLALALAGFAAPVTPADPPAPAAAPAPVTRTGGSGGTGSAAVSLDPAAFRLQATPYSDLIDDLDARLPVVGVPTVVADSNRGTASCRPNAANLVASFCWDLADDIVPYWFPQGITTSADADASGSYQGATAILVSWYDNGTDGVKRGIRVSFIDYSTPSAPAYRHVLLVEPYLRDDGQVSYRPIHIHAGGLAWYGHLLYVVSTYTGLQVFDLRHIWRVDTRDNRAVGLQPDGTYQAFGYKYVLPQVLTYTHSTVDAQDPLRFSFTALDRTSTPPSLVVGEYASPGGGTRLARFPLDATTHLLTSSPDGYTRASEAYDVSVESMQGAVPVNGRWYLSTSDGPFGRGDLAVFRPGEAVRMHPDTLPIGPEDLSYWGGRDQLWSLAEYPGVRSIYAVRASAY